MDRIIDKLLITRENLDLKCMQKPYTDEKHKWNPTTAKHKKKTLK